MLPGISLRSAVVIVPVANVSVAVRELMVGKYDWPMIFVTLAALGTSSYFFSRKSASELRSRILRDTARDLYGEIGRLLDIARGQIAYDRNRSTDAEILMAVFSEEDVLAGSFVSAGSRSKVMVNKASKMK